MEAVAWTSIFDIIGWTGGLLYTGGFLYWSVRFLISLIHDGLGRAILILGTLLVSALWGVVGVLWLVATGVV